MPCDSDERNFELFGGGLKKNPVTDFLRQSLRDSNPRPSYIPAQFVVCTGAIISWYT